jgi:preprotein translocase subunit SecG
MRHRRFSIFNMTTLLTIVHIFVCFFLVVIVLLQQGKGASMGAAFGGSSQTVFGSEGPLPLLNKVTTFAAITFMVTSIALAYLSAHKSTSSVMKDAGVQQQQENGIERSAEPLPEQPMPDLPLTPAEPAAPAPAAEQPAAPEEGAAKPAAPVAAPQEAGQAETKADAPVAPEKTEKPAEK